MSSDPGWNPQERRYAYTKHVREQLSVLEPRIARGVCKTQPPLLRGRRRNPRHSPDSDVREGEARDHLRSPTQVIPHGARRGYDDGATAELRILSTISPPPPCPSDFDVVECEVVPALLPVLLGVLIDIVGCTGDIDGPDGCDGPYCRTKYPYGML